MAHDLRQQLATAGDNLQLGDAMLCYCSNKCVVGKCRNDLRAADCFGGNCSSGMYNCENRNYNKVYNQTAAEMRKMVSVVQSAIHNQGLGARKDFENGEIIAHYAGKYEKTMPAMSAQVAKLKGGGFVNGAVGGRDTRFVNHSCHPNAVLVSRDISDKERIFIVALGPIGEGTEITINYEDAAGRKPTFPCRCPTCVLSAAGAPNN